MLHPGATTDTFAVYSRQRTVAVNQTLRFPILVYPSEDNEGGAFTAHCLSMDIIGDADTVEEAVSALLENIEASLEAAHKHNADVFLRAPQEYWDKLAVARRLSPEVAQRIAFKANLRHSPDFPLPFDLQRQFDMRQLQQA